MTLSNEYPIKKLHSDIDMTIKTWSDLYPISFTRNKSTKTMTIQFSERNKKHITKLSKGENQ